MSDDSLKSAKEAHEEANFLMQKAPKKYTIDYIYHWNRLLLYLQMKQADEEAERLNNEREKSRWTIFQ